MICPTSAALGQIGLETLARVETLLPNSEAERSALAARFGSLPPCHVVPNGFDTFAEVFAGGTVSGAICIPVSVDDVAHPDTQVAIHHTADVRTVFG